MIKGSKSKERLKTCHEDLQKVLAKAAGSVDYGVIISNGHRTEQEQYQLYQKGRTKPGKIVTNCDGYNAKSKHNYFPSLAVDVAIVVKGKVVWDVKHYEAFAKVVLDTADSMLLSGEISNTIIWGGDWKDFRDYPHFEINN